MRALAPLVAVTFAACHTGSHPAPAPSSMQPAHTVEGRAVDVTIKGEHFAPRAFTDLETAANSRTDAGFRARLGTTTLRQVRLQADGSLSAVVPEGLAPGVYDLTVIDPWDHEGLLSAAFRVVAVKELDEVVAGFRIEPIGPQKAGVPFDVSISAIDSDGGEVAYFNGPLTLTDLTGTAVPQKIGYLAYGRWTGKVQVDAAHLADVLTVRDDNGREGRSNAFAIAGPQPASLRFVGAAQTIGTETCSNALRLRLLDLTGFPIAAPAPVAVDVTAEPSEGVTVFQDAACGTPLASLTIAPGSSEAVLYFRTERAGKVKLSASSIGLAGDSVLATAVASFPTRLAFANAPQTVVAGRCSGAVVVAALDSSGNATAAGTALAVSLAAAPSAGFGFYADAACQTPLTSLVIAPGEISTSCYFRGTLATDVLLTAASPGFSGDSQVETLRAAEPAMLAFVTPEQTVVTGGCSQQATVESRDAFGNVAPLSLAVTLALTASPETDFAFFADGGCSTAASSVAFLAGQTQVGFWFRSSVEGDYTLRAGFGGATPAVQLARVRPPVADRLAFVTSPQTRLAGTCSGLVQVQSRDPSNTPRPVASPTTVQLSGDDGLSFFSDAACTKPTAAVELAKGSNLTGFYFRGTRSGVRQANIAVAGWLGASQSEQIDPAIPKRFMFESPPRTSRVGECSPAVTVGLRDVFGNLSAPSSMTNVRLQASPSTELTFYSDAACTSAITSVSLDKTHATADLYFLSTHAGQVTLLAQTNLYGSGSQVELVRARIPGQLVYRTPPRSIVAGFCSALVTVQAQDARGNPAAAPETAALDPVSTPAADLRFYSDGSCVNPVPRPALEVGADATTFYVRGTTAGSYSLTVSAFGTSVTQPFIIEPAATASFIFGPIASLLGQSSPFPVRLEARDAYGNLTPSFTGPATVSLESEGSVTCHDACADAATTRVFEAGVWRGTVSVDTSGAQQRLVAAWGILSATSDAFDVAPAPAISAPVARLTASPAAVTVGQAVLLDASSSYDYQAESLKASFDPSGSAAGLPPWPSSPFGAALTASQTFSSPGVYYPRLAVMDGAGALDYAATAVVVVASSDVLCQVTTGSEVDDGAKSCSEPGPDGLLSFAEAVRIANGSATPLTIGFSGPMAVRGPATVQISAPVRIAGGRGVVLLPSLDVAADTLLADVELEGSALTVGPGARLTLFDVAWRQSAGLRVRGAAALTHVRIEGCQGSCVVDESSAALSLRFSSLFGAPGSVGLDVSTCAPGATPVELQSVVVAGFTTGIREQCDRPLSILHATFDGGERGIAYSGGSGHSLVNAIFTSFSTEAATCATATFVQRAYSELFGNASTGCLGSDTGDLSADPTYVFPAARDFRLSAGSPAIDTAHDLGLDVNAEAPGSFFGTAPDRGGVESS